jgi:ElaB/YqjD/DUF883 family membrane-anchored ribosome-binding protein
MSSGIEKDPTKKIKEGFQSFGADAEEKFNDLREKVMVYREGANEFFDSMSEYIKANPSKSTLIAGGIGLGFGIILGLLMRGGRKD